MECGKLKLIPLKGCSEFTPKQSHYEFKNGVCFKNGDMYGRIIYSDDKLITIEVDNCNRYMKGQIVDFRISPTTIK